MSGKSKCRPVPFIQFALPLAIAVQQTLYIASGASEEIAWVEDFWLPSPANPCRGA
jgi:hypothetical protein